MSHRLSIGQLARHTGVPASTLRYYESLGILSEPLRVGGKRRYSPEAVRQVEAVNAVIDLGFSLAEVRKLRSTRHDAAAAAANWKAMAQNRIRALDGEIERARTARELLQRSLDCEAGNLRDCACPASELAPLCRQ